MLFRSCDSIDSRLPSRICIVTRASLPFLSFIGAASTPATSSAGSSLIPYTKTRSAIPQSYAANSSQIPWGSHEPVANLRGPWRPSRQSFSSTSHLLQPALHPTRTLYNQIVMPETTVRDTVILGSGCAGLTAAIYAARANLKPLVLEGHEPGGQLSITTLVENFPGWPDGIQGPELIDNMKKQAARFGAEIVHGHLSAADICKTPFELTISGEIVLTRSLIIAAGASARWLGLPSEQALIGHGVSSCATCDGFFTRGKEIAVIGGGDS